MSVTSLDWRYRGACGPADLELFFGPEDESGTERQAREAGAKAVCRPCPVKWQCGQYAVTAPEKWGTWGGIGEAERATVRRNYLRRQNGYAA
jgi:WhiB family redox-sensing transcriptional regulator